MRQVFRLASELFQIPHGAKSIIYAPLLARVLHGNHRLVNLLCDIHDGVLIEEAPHQEALRTLIGEGIVLDSPRPVERRAESKPTRFCPTSLTLFVTGACNLACRYCYASGGERPAAMSFPVAMKAVAQLLANARMTGAGQAHLGFHGGGEPTLRIGFMTKVADQARALAESQGIELTLGLTTNGVMPPATLDWVARKIDRLNISIDGPEDIQDSQRPLRSLRAVRSSSSRIAETLDLLDRLKRPYFLRATITDSSEERIPEVVSFLLSRFHPLGVQIEPMFPSERSACLGVRAPDPVAFVQGFQEAERIAGQKGVGIRFSGHRFPALMQNFCGIGRENFAVTPEGKVTACFEVLHDDDPRSGLFFFGEVSARAGVRLDQEKMASLAKFGQEKFSYCGNCFAKFHCAGDCHAKAMYPAITSAVPRGGRCEMIRELTRRKLIDWLETGERVEPAIQDIQDC